MKFLRKEFFYKIIFSLSVSFFLFFLSKSNVDWLEFWGFLSIPASDPFSDFKALNIFLSYKELGFNPYLRNPYSDSVHSVLIYPSIWLHIVDYLKLNIPLNFEIAVIVILLIYFFILADLFYRLQNKYCKYLLVVFLFSSSNFLLVERLNVEIILFCLIYFAIISRNFINQLIFYSLALILKIFPLFSIFMFIEKKKQLFMALIFSIFYLFIIREEITLIKANIIEYALIFAYGSLSISKAIYFYSTKFNFIINEDNYFIFKNLISFVIGLSALIIIITNLNLKKKAISTISDKEKMFLVGAGIYIGTFITSANIDYRLIFLVFTLPVILNYEKQSLKIIYIICLIICFNSLLFEGGNPYSLIYFIKAFFIYLMKFIIFFIDCYFFGMICSKFISINFRSLKNF